MTGRDLLTRRSPMLTTEMTLLKTRPAIEGHTGQWLQCQANGSNARLRDTLQGWLEFRDTQRPYRGTSLIRLP